MRARDRTFGASCEREREIHYVHSASLAYEDGMCLQQGSETMADGETQNDEETQSGVGCRALAEKLKHAGAKRDTYTMQHSLKIHDREISAALEGHRLEHSKWILF